MLCRLIQDPISWTSRHILAAKIPKKYINRKNQIYYIFSLWYGTQIDVIKPSTCSYQIYTGVVQDLWWTSLLNATCWTFCIYQHCFIFCDPFSYLILLFICQINFSIYIKCFKYAKWLLIWFSFCPERISFHVRAHIDIVIIQPISI